MRLQKSKNDFGFHERDRENKHKQRFKTLICRSACMRRSLITCWNLCLAADMCLEFFVFTVCMHVFSDSSSGFHS